MIETKEGNYHLCCIILDSRAIYFLLTRLNALHRSKEYSTIVIFINRIEPVIRHGDECSFTRMITAKSVLF